ncbi:YqcI/YcgG family protein [Laceyella putida]|uniref:YqcI/YcgG family protein n=1 Tax=Laceyella putida TaxID=110101 RepID=A0ABW2RPR3_9BACL
MVEGKIPQWGLTVFKSFESDLLSKERPFPCIFGVEALKKNGLRYLFVENHDEAGLMQLRNSLIRYTEIYRELGRMTSMAVFFKPLQEELMIEQYQEKFWSVLQFLHENDPKPWPAEFPVNWDDPLWEFCFNGEPIFVVCNTPAHVKRRSRRGGTFIITFQPRWWVFEELKGPKGKRGRAAVRQRLEKYDEMEIHPAMGVYGDVENREWKQYYITDSNESPSKCPFRFLHGLSGEKTKTKRKVRETNGKDV